MSIKGVKPIEFEDPQRQAPAKTIAGMDLAVIIRLAGAIVCFIGGIFFPSGSIVKVILMLICFLVAGYDVVLQAVMSLMQEHVADENLLITLASLAAFVVQLDYEGAAIMLLFRLVKLLLEYVVKRSKSSVLSVVDPCPATASVLTEVGESSVSADDVRPGDTIVLRPGDCASVDCIVADGYTSIDSSAVTGSDQLQSVEEGDTILAGCVNVGSLIHGEAMANAADSTISLMRDVIGDENNDKDTLETLAAKYNRFFAPVSIAVCAVYAVLLALFGQVTVTEAVHRSLVIFAVVSPSAFLVSLPLTYFTGINGAAHRGILFRGSAVMERFSRAKAVIFDKNGTITTGAYTVEKIVSGRIDSAILLKAAAHAAANASSPSAQAIVSSYGGAIDYSIIGGFTEFPGGISVTIEDIPVLMGTYDFLTQSGVEMEAEANDGALRVYIALGGRYAGAIYLTDMIQLNATDAVNGLEDMGCDDVVLLSEDSSAKTRALAQLTGITKYYSQCLPMDKLARVQELSERAAGDTSVFVGSAEAEAAAFAAADVGMILGGLNCGGPVDSADVVGMDGDVLKARDALRAARHTVTVARQGAIFALAVKAVLLLVAVLGLSSEVWFAVLVDGCASIACALNAIRAFQPSK